MTDRIELGDSDFANKVELVANIAINKLIPQWVKALLIILAIVNIVGVPVVVGLILQQTGNSCINRVM